MDFEEEEEEEIILTEKNINNILEILKDNSNRQILFDLKTIHETYKDTAMKNITFEELVQRYI
jgi:hypothetical protein